MSTDVFVGIDTSNYTTSVAVSDADGEVLVNLKAPLPVKMGECGLRQSDAVFEHVRNLPLLTEQMRACLRGRTVRAVGVSAQPRTVDGSYMPCFLSGVAAAEMLAAGLDVPLFRFSHQDGHIMAALASSGGKDRIGNAPFAAFHVSGGTTEMLYVQPQEDGFCVEQIGGTADLNAGQAIDRVGVLMGLQFPCGREMEQLALQWNGKLPAPRVCVRDGVCNLSGLQNLAGKLWEQSKDPAMVCAYVFSFVGKTLEKMTEDLDARLGHLPIVYAGGVMSNRYLQMLLGKRADTYFALPQFSADNAAGVALLCRERFLHTAQ